MGMTQRLIHRPTEINYLSPNCPFYSPIVSSQDQGRQFLNTCHMHLSFCNDKIQKELYSTPYTMAHLKVEAAKECTMVSWVYSQLVK